MSHGAGASPPSHSGASCADERRGRGRPRRQDVDDRVLRAAVIELAATGFGAFSPVAVARRAGVAKGTVYLRWPTREQLALDAVAAVSERIEDVDTGTLRGDLLALADRIHAVVEGAHGQLLMRFYLESAIYPELYGRYEREVVEQRLTVVMAAVHRAAARGEARVGTDAQAVAEALTGGAFFLATRGSGAATAERREALVDQILHGTLQGR
ncbi:TetR/AcrR family transcriptional regulator [Streptomyces sp. NPDC005803]|uniref:TetR/AcrR family transcriptional regulator n=1 Tax=Streptomyces sp. NPDC005803 TaxID=3154297 RepID=UPI0033FCE314